MNDRLSDLLGSVKGNFMSSNLNLNPDNDNRQFFDEIDGIKENIEKIQNACKQLDGLTEEAVFTSVNRKGVSAKDKINDLIKRMNQVVNLTKNKLKELKLETDELRKDASQSSTANIRIRDNLLNSVSRKFVDVAKEYQDKQNRYKVQVQGKAERAVKAVKPTVTEEELDAVFRQEDGVKRVLEAAIIKQSGDPVEVSNVLAEVQDTYQDVRRLEASIMELHQMFNDLAFLVEEQGHKLDNIEQNVKEAHDYVKKGNISLQEAIVKAKSVRKRQCCIGGIVLTIIAVIVIIAVVVTK